MSSKKSKVDGKMYEFIEGLSSKIVELMRKYANLWKIEWQKSNVNSVFISLLKKCIILYTLNGNLVSLINKLCKFG